MGDAKTLAAMCSACGQTVVVELDGRGGGIMPEHGPGETCRSSGCAIETAPGRDGDNMVQVIEAETKRYAGPSRADLAVVAASVLALGAPMFRMTGGYEPLRRPKPHRRFPVPK